jgi:ABC-type spermidine/putrescine transport system permease subunit II
MPDRKLRNSRSAAILSLIVLSAQKFIIARFLYVPNTITLPVDMYFAFAGTGN